MDKSALPPLRLLGVIVPVCVAGLGVTCAAAVSFAVTPHRASTLLGLVALLLASTLADRFPVPVEGVDTGGVSLSFVFGVASIVLFGWAAGLLVVFLAPALTQLLEQRPRIRIAYNVSVLALAATAAGALSAPLHDATGPSGVLARVSAAASAQYSVNLVLITAVVAVSSRRSSASSRTPASAGCRFRSVSSTSTTSSGSTTASGIRRETACSRNWRRACARRARRSDWVATSSRCCFPDTTSRPRSPRLPP